MNPRDAVDTDTGVRITVVPAQSAFFAGEDFKVIVTFSNTRSPSAPAKRSVSQTHKRAVHSISYAPLARPPTSPVTPRPAVPPTPLTARPEGKDKKIHARKGLIGDSSLKAGGTGSTSQVLKGKSMSVTISTQELAAALSASVASSLRDASFPANHPHARKHSVLDGQMQAELQLRELSSSPVLAPSGSGSVNNSAFSLSLDTIAEGGSQSEKHSYPPANNHGPNIGLGLGLGTPPQLSESRQPPRSAFATTFAQPGTELVLYAYAQLSGSLTLGNVQGESRAQSQALNAIRNILKRRQAIGGGSMEISSTLESRPNISPVLQRSRSGHGRSASLSSSLMSLISPPMPQHQPWSPGHKARSPSLLASIISPSVSSPAALNNSGSEPVEEVDPSTPLPIYDVQPAVLAVDLVLAPGESRSYTYTLPLPSHLPPTFRGRALKFTYHLTVGVCRARPSPSAPNGRGSTSQVMRVPIRIYNNVDVSMPYPQKPYDLLSPVLNPSSKSQLARVVETSSDGTIISKNKSPEAAMASAKIEHKQNSGSGLKEYTQRLLSSLSKDLPMMVDLDPTSPSTHREMDGGGELTGCREAVEILTRNMRKVSYDVNKNGLKVAVLTFTKSAYRLGETVIGAVEINDLENRARVLKLSAMLEAHESLPSALCPPSSQSQGQTSKKLRKLHAEYHASLTPSVLRTSFALDIPSDASPAFQCECASPYSFSDSARELNTIGSMGNQGQVPGGLTWTVRLCLLVAVASPYATAGVSGARTKGLVRDGPQGEWGSTWRATRGIAPLQKLDAKAQKRAQRLQQHQALAGGPPGLGQNQQQQRGWASYIISSLLSPGEREYHDGDEEDEDEDEEYDERIRREALAAGEGFGLGTGGEGFGTTRAFQDFSIDELDVGGGDEGWSELRAETVECEVPIRVWPGNTAFRPMEVIFDV